MQKIEISSKTIIFTVFFLIFLWFIYQIRSVLLLLFISFILMSALKPSVNRLEKHKIPRFLAILLLYLLVMFMIGLCLMFIIPSFMEQTNILLKNLSSFLIKPGFLELDSNIIGKQLDLVFKNVVGFFRFVSTAFSSILSVFSVAVLTFFLLLERKNLEKYLLSFLNKERTALIEKFVYKVEEQLGGWVRGELLLMIIVGLMSYLGLLLLGVPFTLPLAILAGLLELIPNLGPTISMIPALIVGFSVSSVTAIGVFFLYIVVQQLENNLIVPQVMKRIVGLHPLITLIALMIGFQLGGIGGAVLALPIVLVLKLIAWEIFTSKKIKVKI